MRGEPLPVFRLHGRQPALLEYEDVPVPVVASQETVLAVAPLGDTVLHGVAQVVLYAVRVVFHQLVVVVYDDGGDDGAGLLVFDADVVVLRDVHPVGYAHIAVAWLGALLRGADDVAVYLILAPAHGQQAGVLGLALQEPLAGEGGHQLVQPRLEARAGDAAHVEEYLVCPDDPRIVEREDGHGQGKIEQGVVLGCIRVVGDGLDILHELPALAPGDEERAHDEEEYDAALHRGQDVLLE